MAVRKGLFCSLFFLIFYSVSLLAEIVQFSPERPIPGELVMVKYEGHLKHAKQLTIHWGVDGYKFGATKTKMTLSPTQSWVAFVRVTKNARKTFDVAFTDGNGNWDNNFWQNFSAEVDDIHLKETTIPLGVHYSKESTTFSIWSPDSSNVWLNLEGLRLKLKRAPDYNGYTDVYSVDVPGDHNNKSYQFLVDGRVVRDPYGMMAHPTEDFNIVVDMKNLKPEGGEWATLPDFKEREDAIIYEVHIRDFTIGENSGVSDHLKGKFLGMVESGTRYKGMKTGIDHLKEMGVTHVEILPVYDFATGMYNWGYDPRNYNVPEDHYAIDPYDWDGRIREMKTMVNELHKAGIRVIMDVVYNHTYGEDMFKHITPRYYDGLNLSGVGNSIDSGNPMVSRMIRDSLEFWVKEYNVDGFRFDLMGVFFRDSVKSWGEHLNKKYPEKKLLMYGEPWNGYAWDPNEREKVRYGNVASMASSHVGVFNGAFREILKGDNDGKTRGYMFNSFPRPEANAFSVEYGMRAGIRHPYTFGTQDLGNMWDEMFAYDPEQSINYISVHDNFCLWDKIRHVGEDGEYGRRIVRFGTAMILTSQGIPFLHAGDEMLRTKVVNGNWRYAHNSYNAPDEFNKIRWNWKYENRDLVKYVKELIALRKAHSGLRLNTWKEINDLMKTYVDGNVVVSQIDADKNGDNWDEIIIVFNPGDRYWLKLPFGSWTKVFDENGATNQPNLRDQTSAEGTAVSIFVR